MSRRGRPDQTLTARRGPDTAGRLPPRIPPPALHPVRDNGLARTPPIGWNSWNRFRGEVSDAIVRAIADGMVASGMKDAGSEYVNLDDTWEAGRDVWAGADVGRFGATHSTSVPGHGVALLRIAQ